MDKDFHSAFDLAKVVVVDASKIILAYFEKEFTIRYKEGELSSSIVTQADEETEKFIRSAFEKEFPQYGFIGEETPESNKETSWIVDPIDGTLAFSRGLYEFGMAIALKHGSEVVFSVLYLPYFGKLYSAYISEGAFLNDKKIQVSTTDLLNKSVISLHQKGIKLDRFHDYAENVLKNSTVRMSHSSVVESCLVAEGKIEGLIKFEQKIWDLAPEFRLMKEAGAHVTDEHGSSIEFGYSKDSRQTFVSISPNITDFQELYLPRN